MFSLIEDRGCGIQYTIKTGTLEECQIKKESELSLQWDESELPLYDRKRFNGNGDPFEYIVLDESCEEWS